MGVITHIRKFQIICVIIITFYAVFAEAKGKARLSYSLAETVCTSAARFASNNQIEPPSQSPPINDNLCKTLTWINCEPRTTGACLKFKLKNNCPTNSQGGYSKETKSSRIVNGVDAIPHEFPHIVRFTRDREQLCGGTILNENYIVTAAHCVKPYFYPRVLKYTLEIIAGEHSVNISDGTEQFRNLKKVIWHENFVLNGKYTALNDIALVLLDKPLQFNENVVPLKLPEADYEATSQQGTIKGWGRLYADGPFPDILQKVNMTILSDSKCADVFRGISVIDGDTVVCATTDVVGQDKDICQGDSGGPLTVKIDSDCDDNNETSYLFIGIASYNAICKYPFACVYTQVSKYIDWINKCSQPRSGANYTSCI